MAAVEIQALHERLSGLEVLQRAAQQFLASLDLEHILAQAVQAMGELSEAEHVHLYLADPASGDLCLRASLCAGIGPNISGSDCQATLLNQPLQDGLAQQAFVSGQPVLEPVHSTPGRYVRIAIPLAGLPNPIGVIEASSQAGGFSLNEVRIAQITQLAEMAGCAIENVRRHIEGEHLRLRLETIVNQAEDGFILLDEHGRLVLVNHAARKMFNLGQAAQPGKLARKILAFSELNELLDEGQLPGPHRLEIGLEDGRVMNAQFSPVEGVGAAIVLQDITNLKELDHIKSEFVSAVSHDLRSPLTAILGYTELIERVGPVTPQQQEFIRRAQLSVRNITALINDLLELSRIETGFDVRKDTVQIGALVGYVIEELHGRFVEKAQAVEVDLPDDLPPVLGNALHLRRLLNNLAGNANKYTPAGGRIVIRAMAQDDQLIVQVSDNGPGIPAGEQGHIFEKFYRGSNVPVDIPGTGLGLAIVKSIVESHRGRIWVDSTLGKGSVFTLALPVAGAL